jgi:hypothetical protein
MLYLFDQFIGRYFRGIYNNLCLVIELQSLFQFIIDVIPAVFPGERERISGPV